MNTSEKDYLLEFGIKYPNDNKFMKKCYASEISKLLVSAAKHGGYVFGDFVINYLVPSLDNSDVPLNFKTLDIVMQNSGNFLDENSNKLFLISKDETCDIFVLKIMSNIAVVKIYKDFDIYEHNLLLGIFDENGDYTLESYFGDYVFEDKTTQMLIRNIKSKRTFINDSSIESFITDFDAVFPVFEKLCDEGWTVRLSNHTEILTKDNIKIFMSDLFKEKYPKEYSPKDESSQEDLSKDDLTDTERDALEKFDKLMVEMRQMYLESLRSKKN